MSCSQNNSTSAFGCWVVGETRDSVSWNLRITVTTTEDCVHSTRRHNSSCFARGEEGGGYAALVVRWNRVAVCRCCSASLPRGWPMRGREVARERDIECRDEMGHWRQSIQLFSPWDDVRMGTRVQFLGSAVREAVSPSRLARRLPASQFIATVLRGSGWRPLWPWQSRHHRHIAKP